MDNFYKRGEIVVANLGQHPGTSMHSGIKLCLVVSNNKSNQYSRVITLCPLTSKIKKKPNPVHVRIKPDDTVGGILNMESDILVEQIQTLSVENVFFVVADVMTDSDVIKNVEHAMCRQLGIG